MYEANVALEIRSIQREAAQPKLLDRLLRVIEEQRGTTLAMEVEDAKIALVRSCGGRDSAGVGRTRSERLPSAARISSATQGTGGTHRNAHRDMSQASGPRCKDIDVVFLTGGRCSWPMSARHHRGRIRCAGRRRRHVRRGGERADNRSRQQIWQLVGRMSEVQSPFDHKAGYASLTRLTPASGVRSLRARQFRTGREHLRCCGLPARRPIPRSLYFTPGATLPRLSPCNGFCKRLAMPISGGANHIDERARAAGTAGVL